MSSHRPTPGHDHSFGRGSGIDAPVATTPVSDTTIDILVARERSRLESELGITDKHVQHAARPEERPFTKAERPFTTVLFGGLTWKHERLIQAMMHGLGYKAEYLATPNVRAFQTGKEYGNNGQCNPTYFTVGNLIEHLSALERSGLSRRDIIDRHVFFTAGACGPCRFGMYEAEFRLALRNAGFDGFRVLILEQSGGLNQASGDMGLEMNLDFTLGILNAFMIADVLNDVAYQLRPFELVPGATDAALNESIEIMARVMERQKAASVPRAVDGSSQRPASAAARATARRFLAQLFGRELLEGMTECRALFAGVKVDRTRLRPVVKVTGEFWAQTTEGDGNFNMFRFLEKEGAQVMVEPISTWLLYLLHQVKQETRDRKFSGLDPTLPPLSRVMQKAKRLGTMWKKVAIFTFAEKVYMREYNRLRRCLDNMPHELPNQYAMQRIAHPYYNTRLEGGEGHLEVAKNIYYTNKSLCHMVLSVKPFGCMPSTQSDGVQSAVTSHHKDIIYLPIETSGEGEINAHSRVQMVLGEARAAARAELQRAVEQTGLTLDDARAAVADNPVFSDPFLPLRRTRGIVGVAPNFLLQFAPRLGAARKERTV